MITENETLEIDLLCKFFCGIKIAECEFTFLDFSYRLEAFSFPAQSK